MSALLERKRQADDQALYGSAMICSLLANINRDTKQRKKPYTPADFMPVRKPKAKKRQTWQDMKLMGKLWTLACGGTIKEKK